MSRYNTGQVEKYNTVELWRCLLTIGVVFGHTYCIFFQSEYLSISGGKEWTTIHNLCVDCFFVMSGIFIAKSVCKLQKKYIDKASIINNSNFAGAEHP